MENGKLNIFKSKDKKSVVEILFTNKKGKQTKLGVQGADISDEYSGKDVEFERDEKGQPVKITLEGNDLFTMKIQKQADASIRQETHPDKSDENQMEMDHLDYVQYPASAPYNFIPLNKVAVEAEEPPTFDRYHDGRYTGWIDLEIETVTPLYIRDTLNEDERKRKAEAEKEDRKYDNPDFFSPGKMRIPGSSLRGMVRTLVEIVSFGKFGFFDDKRLYFRSFADITQSLRSIYSGKMIQQTQGAYTIKPLAGYLKKQKSGNFIIIPALLKDNITYYKVEENLLIGKVFYPHAMSISFKNREEKIRYKPNKDYKFFVKPVFFKKNAPTVHKHSQNLYYGQVTDIQEDVTHSTGWEKGTLVCTGWVPSKRKGKHMHWVVNEKNPSLTDSELLKINDDLLKSYKDDVNRDEQADLLKQLENHPEGVPCFYITDEQGKVSSFGHTGMFRLAYEKTIGDHIPENLKDSKKTDLAEAIFGKVAKDKEEKTLPGRIFFEDAFLKQGQQAKDVLMDKKTPQILAAPKPTTFQHYLEPSNKQPNHYNSDALIRGHKFYWHKSGKGWEETDSRKSQKQYTEITPVKPETRFSGRIRFENLSQVELGALLFSLELPEECCHKLGMGKPLGLGSVKIIPKLYLSDRKKRYADLFAEWGNNIIPQSDDKIQEVKTAFEQHVLVKIGEQFKKSLWDTERLKELKLMLDYERGKKLESQNNYMEIEKFKKRLILPKPSCVSTV